MSYRKYFLGMSMTASLVIPINDKVDLNGDFYLKKHICSKYPEFDNLVYKPRLINLNGHWSTIFHGICNRYHILKNKVPFDYKTHVFKLSDGG